MDLSIYDLIVRLLQAGERVNWVSFHPTITREGLDRVGGRRVPYDQPIQWLKAKDYLEPMFHSRLIPKIRVHTDRRNIFVFPAEIGQMVWHDRGTLEPFTFVTTQEAAEVEASQQGASA